MKVVVARTTDVLGVIGETKDVKPGYARNFLFPRKLAVLPTDPRAKAYRAARGEAVASLTKERALIAELADMWRGQTVIIKARASDDGTLYGSVGTKEILKALGRDDVACQAPSLKRVGTHTIELTLPPETAVPLTVVIEAEKTSAK